MLGQALVEVYATGSENVIAWDRDDLDVTDFTLLKERINDLWPDVIYNTVAYNAVDACENDDDEYAIAHALNVALPQHLAKIAKQLNATMVHYSTDYVFDGKQPVYDNDSGRAPGCCGGHCPGCMYMGDPSQMDYFEYQEGDKTRPLSRYGRSKRDGERALSKEAGSSYYIIRLSKLFGKPATSRAGKMAFFDIMLTKGKEAQRSGETVNVVDAEVSKFTYAPDLAAESRAIVEERCASGIYHVANEGACTWYDGVQELYNIAGLSDVAITPVSPQTFPRPAQRPRSSVLKTTKREPLRHYTDALREYLAD